MQHAKGAYMYDVDGNRYVDYINSWGPMIMGHAYEPVVKAIQEYATYSTSFGAPTELEISVAELIVSMVPNIDMVRMVNSGTEACMSALRLARGFTGRNKVIKFGRQLPWPCGFVPRERGQRRCHARHPVRARRNGQRG